MCAAAQGGEAGSPSRAGFRVGDGFRLRPSSKATGNRRDQKLTNLLGWQTSAETRGPIIEGLARVIREQGTDGDGFELLCLAAVDQLMAFILKPNGALPKECQTRSAAVLAVLHSFRIATVQQLSAARVSNGRKAGGLMVTLGA